MDSTENICRICLLGTNSNVDILFVNIFTQDDLQTQFNIIEALQNICRLEVSKEDGLPNQICFQCHSRLEDAHRLCILSHRSEETLRNIFLKATTHELQTFLSNHPDTVTSELVEEFNDRNDEEINTFEAQTMSDDQSREGEQSQSIYCCGCEASFSDERKLRKHSIMMHRPRKLSIPKRKVRCNVCFALFADQDSITTHKQGRNDLQPAKTCVFCKCVFYTNIKFDDHQNMFHSDKLFKCCGCSFRTENSNEFKAHSLRHKDHDMRNSRNKHRCRICSSRFESRQEQRTHERLPYRRIKSIHKTMEKQESNEAAAVCCGCNKVFFTTSELHNHQEQVHRPQREGSDKNELQEECKGCFKRFKNECMLDRHLCSTSRKKFFECSKCSVARRTFKELLDHMAVHQGKEAFICCGCRKRFDTQEDLEQHSKEVHAIRPKYYHVDNLELERPFECKICYRRYKCERILRNHQQYVYYDKIHTCDICGKGFSQKKALVLHLATHKTEAEHPCAQCGKRYKHDTLARRCEIRHDRPQEYRCRFCNATFPNGSNLNSHLVSHSDERHYKCDICNQTFKRSTHLQSHKIKHTSEKNYSCKYCPSKFGSSTAQHKHEILHTGIYPYRCEICGKVAKTRLHYVKHYEAHIEGSLKVFQCHLCEQRYSKDHFLSNHMKYSHRIEPQDKDWDKKFNRQSSKKYDSSSIDRTGMKQPLELVDCTAGEEEIDFLIE
ncbi:zinc finger protein 90-like [Toxorhynchites rutilus septentrionalis]|uniref:zinc finger protein 90-like n=1 Tax=Toxorhynchites rutilus septentrionalis TaxID=329112 RepID=UPI002478CD44|nr:zinc finger protein 90-like [Toxorhynchites rutilus septentrionalis]